MGRSRSRSRARGNGATILNVSNLTRNVNEAHLEEIFGIYGKVKSVNLGVDKQVKLPKGYAYVEYADPKQAEYAVEHMHGGQIDGNCIGVNFVNVPKKEEKKKEQSKRRARSPSSSSSSSSGSRSPPRRKK